MDDYETNVKHLQKWISDTKKLAAAPPAVEQMVTPVEKHQLQQVSVHTTFVPISAQSYSYWRGH